MTADIRAYLRIRTASPGSFNRTGDKLLISSNVPGTAQVHRLDVDRLDAGPSRAEDLVQVTPGVDWDQLREELLLDV